MTHLDSKLLSEYFAMLAQYKWQLRRLFHHLEPLVQLHRLVHGSVDFLPTASSISKQIQHWPDNLFFYPPVAWVYPRIGMLAVDHQPWSFLFHGSGLSFFHEETKWDVSGEFSRDGTLAITEHTTWCDLTTVPTGTTNRARLESLHEQCFTEAEARQALVRVPPLLEADDQTYQIIDRMPIDA